MINVYLYFTSVMAMGLPYVVVCGVGISDVDNLIFNVVGTGPGTV